MIRPVYEAISQRQKWWCCLKPRVGLITVMEETPDHPPDIGIFRIKDIIDGHLGSLAVEKEKVGCNSLWTYC